MSEKVSSDGAQTRVHHVCSRCAAVLGTSLMPWAGQAVLTSHGLCRWCFVEVRLRDHLARSPLRPGSFGTAAGAWSGRNLAAQGT